MEIEQIVFIIAGIAVLSILFFTDDYSQADRWCIKNGFDGATYNQEKIEDGYVECYKIIYREHRNIGEDYFIIREKE